MKLCFYAQLCSASSSATGDIEIHNGSICFVRLKRGQPARLWLVEPDGSNERPLTPDGMGLTDPAWSLDGTRLVAVGGDPGSRDSGMFLGELHLVSADGREVTRVTRDESVKLRPAWSPDGTEIVFERAVGRSGYHLFVVHPDGTGLRQITGPPVPGPEPVSEVDRREWMTTLVEFDDRLPSAEEMPAWSPDGSAIAFVCPVEREAGTGDFGVAHHIFTVASDGKQERQLTDGPVHDVSPCWSPDGEKLVFTRYTDDEFVPSVGGRAMSGVRLWLVNADGSGLEPLTEEPAGYQNPCWSPDGTTIACSRSPTPTHLYSIDVAGRYGRVLTRPAVDGDYQPSWQPVR